MFQVWQAKNAVFCTEAELGSLHRAAQTKFNRFVAGWGGTVLHCTVLHCTVLHCTVLYCTALYRFVAGLPARRLAEHRTNLARAQIRSNMQIIEEAPGK